MPQVRTSDYEREAGAILRADLLTCCACTLEGLRLTAQAALEAVYRKPQHVVVHRDRPSDDDVSILVTGPDFFGSIKLSAPGYD